MCRGEKRWSKVSGAGGLWEGFEICTPISGCFLETEDRSADFEGGGEGVCRGEKRWSKVSGAGGLWEGFEICTPISGCF